MSPQLLEAQLDQSGAGGSDSEIEITPQMIEAVMAYLREAVWDDGGIILTPGLARGICRRVLCLGERQLP